MVKYEDGRTGTFAADLRSGTRRASRRPRPARGMSAARRIGGVILAVDNVSLAFGGVAPCRVFVRRAVSTKCRHHRAERRRQRARLLNVLTACTTPRKGNLLQEFRSSGTWIHRSAAKLGSRVTFQNIALFKGMTVLDNINDRAHLKMRCNFLQQALWVGPARRESSLTARRRGDHRLPRDPAHPQDAGRAAALRPAEARRARPRACRRAGVLLLDEPMAGNELEEKAGHVPLRPRRQRSTTDHPSC